MPIRHVTSSVRRGLLAGFAGTLAMTAVQLMEARRRSGPTRRPERPPGTFDLAPEPPPPPELPLATHWAYGVSWGGLRGALGALGLRGTAALPAHLALVWGAQLIMMAALGRTPPPWRWPREALARALIQQGVYTLATSVAYALLADEESIAPPRRRRSRLHRPDP